MGTLVHALEQIRTQARAKAADVVREVAAGALTTLIADWPGRDRDVHIYARDRSKHTWELDDSRLESDLLVIVRNTSDYSGFTNDGYTRKGAETARSFPARGNVPYVKMSLDRALAGLLRRHAVRFGGGR